MKFHIVRNKETLEDILYIYNLTKDELIEQNKHIRVWDKLIPGTKLKIPPITEAVELEVSDIEPFVEDYYPSVPEKVSQASSIKIEEEYKKIEDDSSMQIIQEEKAKEEKPISSKIYEEYEEQKKPVEEEKKLKEAEKPVKEEIKQLEGFDNYLLLNQFSNMQVKPLLNNYYPYYLGVYNAPRYIPYPIIYYPVYYPKKPN